jgi:hypothetical protein
MNTGSLGLLVEACKTCDDSYSASEGEEETDGGVLYCKARGMPFDHIDSNAILNFDEGQYKVHGAELKCSYHLCRADGIKFRWCAICNKAVAKRNFRKRHAHPGSEVQHLCPPMSKVKKRKAMSDDSLNRSQWKPIKREEDSLTSIPNNVRNEAFSSNHSQVNVSSQHDLSTWRHYNPMSMPGLGNDPLHCELNPSKVSIPQPWIDLFHSRPVGGSKEDVKHWLVQAMFVAGLSNENEQNDEGAQIQSNPVVATREEFSGAIPPRFINYARCDEKDRNVAKYRQHADTLSLQINTDLDSTSNSILLDSEGSIHITPRISF